MVVLLAIALIGLVAWCTIADGGDQDFLRDVLDFTRDDVRDAHALADEQSPPAVPGEPTSETDGWLRRLLDTFPDADLDGDGLLRASEARTWFLRSLYPFAPDGHELDTLPDGVTHWKVDLPMSTGGTLATEVYLPAGGGPWPAVLTRSGRGRMDSALDFGVPLLATGKFAFVGQDRSEPGPRRERDGRADGRDTIEWIAAQPWCNGRVGMFGYSEAGRTAQDACVTNPPHMDLCVTGITSITRDPRDGVCGGRRIGRGRRPTGREGAWAPPAPVTEPYHGPFEGQGQAIDVPLNDKTGWFDLFTGAIEEWNEMRRNGKSILVVGAGTHPGLRGMVGGRVPPLYADCDVLWREMPSFRWLTGDVEPGEVRSVMYYFLMGDCLDPEAPGNAWKETEEWPVPCVPTSLYLAKDGKLAGRPAEEEDASLTYRYDPADPVPAIPCFNAGMPDQRPLADRADILRFETVPLETAVEITGRAALDLYVGSDAPDTMFCASIVDVYPDGYEAILLEGAAMGRFHAGFDDPQPLEEGQVYRLGIAFIDTAYVFAPGHRVRVHVTSSGQGRFTVHPNTWDAVESYDRARIAANTVHCSATHASRLVLPVIEPGVSRDYGRTDRPRVIDANADFPPGRGRKGADGSRGLVIPRAAPANGLPNGWTAEERTVAFAAPEGDREANVTVFLNSLKLTGEGRRPMELVRVPAGRVEIDDPAAATCRVVELARPIYVATCDVTQAQYAEVMGRNPSRFLGHDLPVQCVSWADAEEFCRCLSERDGVTYRLPSAEEWEYACRAGAPTRFWWGDESRDDTAWYGPHMGGRPAPVGCKLANRFGLFDMAGNVREWTRCDPDPESDGSMRRGYGLCGGPYGEQDWSLACDVRIDYPDRYDGHNQCGFRVVVDVE